MANVSGNVLPTVSFTQIPSSGFLSGIPFSIPQVLRIALANGTSADQIDLIHAKTYAFTASTPQTIDLKVLTDIFAASVAFVKVRVFAAKVYSQTSGATLTLAPNASNGWNTMVASSGGIILAAASSTNADGAFTIFASPVGWSVGASTKSFDMTPSAHAFNVDLLIAGSSA